MRIDWDAGKAKRNLAKHGVSFEEAETVFNDKRLIELFDDVHSVDEDRFVVIGRLSRARVLFVVYAERYEDTIRIITARRANRGEQAIYGKVGLG